MKILITGASGILGGDFVKIFESLNYETLGLGSQDIDITNFDEVKQKVKNFKPDLIVHCAAMTNVDLCEDQRGEAFKANVIASQNFSIAAVLNDCKIVYISSCGVYGDGKSRRYIETDATNPLNYHHFTKLEGEKMIINHNKNYLIIRPGWLYGGSTEHKKNFVEARRIEAVNNNRIFSTVDKRGIPTCTSDLVKQVILLIDKELFGTFNIANLGSASRFDYVSEIIDCFNLPTVIEGVTSDKFPKRRANMPNNEMIENSLLNYHGLNIMREWKIALKDYICETYNISK